MTTLIRSAINPKYISKLAKTIYNNFIYLKDIPQLEHNIQTITDLLSNPDNKFFFLYQENSLIGYLIAELKTLNDGRFVCYVDYIYIAPRSQNHEMFFADHFSLNPKILEKIVWVGFKAGINALRDHL